METMSIEWKLWMLATIPVNFKSVALSERSQAQRLYCMARCECGRAALQEQKSDQWLPEGGRGDEIDYKREKWNFLS